MRKTQLLAGAIYVMFYLSPVQLMAGDDYPSLMFHGNFRFAGGYIRNPAGSSIDGLPSHKDYFEFRLRLNPEIPFTSSITAYASMDLASNVTFGGEGFNALGNNASFYFRRIYLRWLTPFGLLEAGRMPNHWGLGIFVNSGDGFDTEFGFKRYGDTVDRILFATKPFGRSSHFILALGYDKVAEENLLNPTDDADDWLSVLLYSTQKVKAGTYFVARIQPSTRTRLYIPDLYFHLYLDSDSLNTETISSLEVAFEGVIVTGHTEVAPALIEGEFRRKVLMAGCAGFLKIASGAASLKIESGFASGDENPAGGDITSFTFNPDYNVGIFAFEESLKFMTARSARIVRENTAESPEIKLFETRGGVTDAFYIFPVVSYLVKKYNLELKGAFLYAYAPRRFVDPATSLLYAGGSPTGFDSSTAGKSYGYEVDLGVKWQARPFMWIKAEGGVFFPGDVFGDAPDTVGGINIYLVTEF